MHNVAGVYGFLVQITEKPRYLCWCIKSPVSRKYEVFSVHFSEEGTLINNKLILTAVADILIFY